MPGSELQKFFVDCTEHALLTEKELDGAKQVMYNYVVILVELLKADFLKWTSC